LRSKVKVPQRSLRYATHRLMVMHPHTKYNWPIWKDKKVMVRTSFPEKKQKKRKWNRKQKRKKKIRLKQYVSLCSKGRHNKHDVIKCKFRFLEVSWQLLNLSKLGFSQIITTSH
jgi:hypothetical protein